MKAFRTTGTFRAGKRDQPFTLDVVAEDEEGAREKVLSNFGSRHGVPRRFVNIGPIDEIKPSESTEPNVVSYFRK
tara:strand:- start:914 stop:1138 length:225 start_codon:yes stop_codon:yes gene_type:complete